MSNTLPLRMPNIHSCMIFCALHYECKRASFVRRMCYVYSSEGSNHAFKAALTFSYNNKSVGMPLTLTAEHVSLFISGTLPTEGITYSGTLNRTRDGSMCLPWSLFKVRGHYESLHFPDQSASDALNYCRQTGKYIGNPYCHVDAYNVLRVKSCDVVASDHKAYKSCILPRNGYLYRGSKSVTVTGRKCMSWLHAARLSKYLPKLYEDIPNKAFSGSRPSKKYAASYCRNPTPQTRYGPWCFIEYEEHGKLIHSWEYCDVCSKVKPVAELQIGYVKDMEVTKDVLYLKYNVSSEYECQHLCSILAHCSAVMFTLNNEECLIGWRNVAKDLMNLSFKPIADAHLIYIFRKPCILKERETPPSIIQRCQSGESCYHSDKIEYMSRITDVGDRLCGKHCFESTTCFQYLLVGEYCYIYRQDVCGCFSRLDETRKDVLVVTRCYEFAEDEIYFENDEVHNIFNADDYLMYQKSALSWVPADDNGTDQEESRVSILETIERKKDMGNLEDEGMSPAYLGKVLKVLIIVWTSLIAIITFVTFYLYLPYL